MGLGVGTLLVLAAAVVAAIRPGWYLITHGAASLPRLDHVIVIVEENKAASQVLSQPGAMPYFNQTLVPAGALATNYFGITNPSLPNYLALTYGSDFGNPGDVPPNQFSTSTNNVANSLENAGKSWKAYMEGMPSNCDKSDNVATHYFVHHNPFAYSTKLPSCTSNDVPFSQFATDLSHGTLPTFAFIVPNWTDDGHTGAGISAELSATDSWLQREVPAILTSPTFTQTNTLLAITWDEGTKTPVDNHIPLLLLGNSSIIQPDTRDMTTYSSGHYSLLHTIESGLGLGTLTSNDANAPLMSALFRGSTQPTTSTPTSTPTITATRLLGSNNVIEDDFTRPDQAHFGRSTNTDSVANGAWEGAVSSSGHASISGGVGTFSYSGSPHTVYTGYLGASQSGAVDVLARVAFAAIGSDQFRLFAHNSGPNYAAELDTSANVLHVYYKDSSSAQHTLGKDFAISFAANTRYWVRLDVAHGVVSARVWQDGTNEPSTWQVSGRDTHLTSGDVGEGFSWATAPSGGGDITQSAFAAATDGHLAAAPDSGIIAPAPGRINPPPLPASPLAGATLSVSGDTLVDQNGGTVVLRGFSQGPSPLNTLTGWQARRTASGDGSLSVTALHMMVAWGANTVRIPVSAYICARDGSNCAGGGPYMTEVQLDINAARSSGLYVIVSAFDDLKAGSPYTDHHYHPEEGTFLAQVAARFKNDAGVLYDVVNEPVYTSDSSWASDMNSAIALIRAAGSAAPIVVEKPDPGTHAVCKTAAGVAVGEQVAFTASEVAAINDPTIIFSDHRYHAVVNGDPTSESCLLGAAEGAKPFLVGEWGVLPHSGVAYQCQGLTNGNAGAVTNGFMNWSLTGNAGAAVSWTAWNFKPVTSITDSINYSPTTFNTGSWSCDDGSAAAASAGEGSDIKAWLASH